MTTRLATLALAIFAALATISLGCPDAQQALQLHNQLRAKHGAPPMSWDNGLANDAQAWANHLASMGCQLVHSSKHGENLYMSTGGAAPSCTQATQVFYNEIKSYRFTNRPWTDNKDNFHAIGHFTQLVWMGSTRLGCAGAQGPNCWVVACEYDPRGNIMGDSSFFANVKPPGSNPGPGPDKCAKCNLPASKGGCPCDSNCNCVATNKCDKCNLPTSKGGCSCDSNCNCVATNKCDKCNLPASKGGCSCDSNCDCVATNKCDKCMLPTSKGGCSCDANCNCVATNKCDKCNLPTSKGGCSCDSNCDCVATNKCDKCNLPASQGGCKCNNNCDCI